MKRNFRAVRDSGEIQVSFEQWNQFLSVAYGSYVATEDNFLIHSYLVITHEFEKPPKGFPNPPALC
jgi:hypothetical protein